MQDRMPTPGQEGRVLITPESGSPYYAKIEMADNPLREGTPLNKSTLLKDSTAEALGLTSEAVVDDAFLALVIGANNYGIRIHAQMPNGAPVPGARITGVNDIYGNALYTDDNGDALGVASSATGSFTVQSVYIDISNASQSYSLTQKITEITVTLTQSSSTERSYTSSQSGLKFSPYVSTFDVCAVGGGGGGSSTGGNGSDNNETIAGAGGGGGHVTNRLNITNNSNTNLDISIGAGGTGGSSVNSAVTKGKPGGKGGTTTVSYGSISVTADGGNGGEVGTAYDDPSAGGSGNGRGGDGSTTRYSNTRSEATDGTNGTVYKFSESSLGLAGGGGGGGGSNAVYGVRGLGGSPNGGDGGESGIPIQPENGTSPGGGGGGGGDNSSTGGYGGKGIVYLRWVVTA